MPQPAEVGVAAARGAAHWAAAGNDVDRLVASVLTGGSRKPVASAMRSITRRLEAAAVRWAATSLPAVYVLGGEVSAALVGTRVRSGELAEDLAEIVAEAEAEAKVVGSALRRQAARWTAPKGLPVLTPSQVAALSPSDLASLLGRPVGLVRYADGSLRTVADHGDMLTRTRASLTFNRGTLDYGRVLGLTHVECLDGADCGLATHDGSPKANGLVLPMDEAYAHLLAHPRCQRSFRARPEVRSAGAAAMAEALGPPPAPDGPADLSAVIVPRGRRPRAAGTSRARRLPRTARRARAARRG